MVEIVGASCTESVCPPDNPCCNYCGYSLGFKIDAFHYLYFSGEGAGCGGNSCLNKCTLLLPGRRYDITGNIWKNQVGLNFLQLKEWRFLGPMSAK
jgi:hypothetical protein